jgi:bifunctional non-homologous end joining protein LigD
MLQVRTRRPVGRVPPCLPSRADRPPSGPEWLHEIKHDGFRIMARRDDNGVRLYARNGYDFADRFPQIVEAVSKLKVQSFFIDGFIVRDSNGQQLAYVYLEG